MGYYTYFTLTVEPDAENIETYQDELRDMTKYCYLFEEECTWYDYEEDMREFSKRHPDKLFTLYGEGEQFGDSWYEYYQNGLMQRCESITTYPPYNKDLMS